MKNIKWYKIIPIFINLFVIISTLAIIIIDGSQSGEFYGINFFKKYTVDSNLLLAISSLPLLIYEIKDYRKDDAKLPRWSVILYFVGVVTISLTFLVVVFFLTPTFIRDDKSPAWLYTDENLFFHIINPILGVIMYLFVIDEHPLGIKHCLLPFIPIGIYEAIYTSCVLTNTWTDFYGFTFGGKYELTPIIIIVILLISFLVGMLLNKFHNRLVFAHNRVPIM